MYSPIWFGSRLTGIFRADGGSIPFDNSNTGYQDFLVWLKEQGKTQEQWLAENPPPEKSEQQVIIDTAVEILKEPPTVKATLEERVAYLEKLVDAMLVKDGFKPTLEK